MSSARIAVVAVFASAAIMSAPFTSALLTTAAAQPRTPDVDPTPPSLEELLDRHQLVGAPLERWQSATASLAGRRVEWALRATGFEGTSGQYDTPPTPPGQRARRYAMRARLVSRTFPPETEQTTVEHARHPFVVCALRGDHDVRPWPFAGNETPNAEVNGSVRVAGTWWGVTIEGNGQSPLIWLRDCELVRGARPAEEASERLTSASDTARPARSRPLLVRRAEARRSLDRLLDDHSLVGASVDAWRAALAELGRIRVDWRLTRAGGMEAIDHGFITPDPGVRPNFRLRYSTPANLYPHEFGVTAVLQILREHGQPVVACGGTSASLARESYESNHDRVVGRIWGVTEEDGVVVLWLRGCRFPPPRRD